LKGRGISEKVEITNAIIGRMTICENSPIINGRGKTNTFLKLEDVRESPTPSIIIPSMELIRISFTEYSVVPVIFKDFHNLILIIIGGYLIVINKYKNLTSMYNRNDSCRLQFLNLITALSYCIIYIFSGLFTIFVVMNQLFHIFRLDTDQVKEITESLNEPHVHDFEELIVGMAGELEHFIDFRSEKFTAPFVSFITKGKVHKVKPSAKDGSFDMWVIEFKSEFIPETTFQLYSWYHDNANIQLREGYCFDRLSTLCEMMHEEMKIERPDYAVIRILLNALITMIENERKKTVDQGIPTGNQNTTFKNFLKILEENFRRPEGVDFYAEKLFMSARNLNLICQNIMQKSVSEIIETRKLIEAKNLLSSTDKTVSEIGYELGFNEKSYFTAVFRKKTGQTPTEFRKEMKKLAS
jgi:AraC-like DNA-binding protein